MIGHRALTIEPIHELLAARWSPVAFSTRAVEATKLRALFEAARWAPSSFNEQPWRFIVATKDQPAEFERLLGVLVEGNRMWAQHAPMLALSVAKLTFTRNAKPNLHALYDTGAATAQLIVQATVLGLFVHQMAGYDADKAREVFAIPADFQPGAAMAIGYLGDGASLPEALRQRDSALRQRRPLETQVFAGRWGETAPFVR
jgi:nitroreductase